MRNLRYWNHSVELSRHDLATLFNGLTLNCRNEREWGPWRSFELWGWQKLQSLNECLQFCWVCMPTNAILSLLCFCFCFLFGEWMKFEWEVKRGGQRSLKEKKFFRKWFQKTRTDGRTDDDSSFHRIALSSGVLAALTRFRFQSRRRAVSVCVRSGGERMWFSCSVLIAKRVASFAVAFEVCRNDCQSHFCYSLQTSDGSCGRRVVDRQRQRSSRLRDDVFRRWTFGVQSGR